MPRPARAKIATRSAPAPTDDELTHGVPLFLSQLADALDMPDDEVPGEQPPPTRASDVDLLRMGFIVAQVIHDYGDICQAVKELAVDRGAHLTAQDFERLGTCLDRAVAREPSQTSPNNASNS